MQSSAVITRDGKYRYVLRRVWDLDGATVLFVGLNPSTADHRNDDPTVRRCVQFARDWGLGGVAVANLFAFRTASPQVLRRAVDPVGRRNDSWLRRLVAEAALIVVAWGNDGGYMGRDRQVLEVLREPHCLAVSKRGQPKHPLYIPRSAVLREFKGYGL